MKIDVPLSIPEGVDFPEYKNKEQLKALDLAPDPDPTDDVSDHHGR